jgi:hypothetical protein
MKDSFSFFTNWKNKAETSDTLTLDNNANKVAQFDIDVSQPIASLDFVFSGRLAVVGGGQDPVATLDKTLRMFTMSMWIERENGNIDIIQSNTPLHQVYRSMQKIIAALKSSCTPGGFAIPDTQNATPFPYASVSGNTASANQDYAFHFPFYFGFLSSYAGEYQAGILMPRSDFRSLKVQFNNIVNQNGQVSVARNYPFPNSNNTYTFAGFGGVGVASVQCFITQPDPGKLDSSPTGAAGKVIPVLRRKTLLNAVGILAGSGIQNELIVDKWDRGILWQGTSLFEDLVTVANGSTANGAQLPDTVVNGPAQGGTVLRDITLFANSMRLSEWNNLLEVLRQNTQSSAARNTTKTDSSPSLLLYTKLGQFATLGDLRRFFTANDTVIYQFDNVQDPNSEGTVVWVDILNYGYQQV